MAAHKEVEAHSNCTTAEQSRAHQRKGCNQRMGAWQHTRSEGTRQLDNGSSNKKTSYKESTQQPHNRLAAACPHTLVAVLIQSLISKQLRCYIRVVCTSGAY
eukprot:1145430-Pelagomonas_calceolata.AAC.6